MSGTRQRWALVLAVAVVVVTVAAVALFGIVPYPSPPSVAEQPEPTIDARLAYVTYDDGACLHVVGPRGEGREVGCGSTFEGELVPAGDGRVGVMTYRGARDGTVEVVDVDTGDVVAVEQAPDDAWPSSDGEGPDGRVVRTGQEGGAVVVEVAGRDSPAETILTLDAPDDYGLYRALWTPDGRWVVVVDSLDRALVVPADGDGPARVWATDVRDVLALPPQR